MKVYWHLDLNRLVAGVGNNAAPSGFSLKYLTTRDIELYLIDANGALTNYEGESPVIHFGIKPVSEFDGDFTLDTEDFTWDADLECYKASIRIEGTPIATALSSNGDASDDAGAVECKGEFEITLPADATNPLCHDGFVCVTIQNKIIRGDEEPVPATSSRLWPVKHLIDVTGLTGGGLTNLDGALNITSADNKRLLWLVINDVPQLWQVVQSTAAESVADGIVRPDNFHATTNPYLYVQRL